MADKKTVLEWADERGLTEYSRIVFLEIQLDRLRAKLTKMEAAGNAMYQYLKADTMSHKVAEMRSQWQEAKL